MIRATLLCILIVPLSLPSQQRTVGVLKNDPRAFPGYTLFAPNRFGIVYLIDNDGRQIHTWNTRGETGQAVYLLADGSLLHLNTLLPPGGRARMRRYDWTGNILWDFDYGDARHLLHHDMKMLPGGNVLMIAWEFKTADEARRMGRDSSLLPENALWPDELIEVKPTGPSTGDIVWEWHAWDHLVQDREAGKPNYGLATEHPELIDVNFTAGGPGGAGADWMHANSVAYNAELDQILLSVHNFSEVWVIDHGTTSAEAAGHSGGRRGRGGDILFRWGNPAAYGQGSKGDQILFGQHDAQWIQPGLPGAGDILLFNNGLNRPQGKFSTAEEFLSPADSAGDYPAPMNGRWGAPDTLWRFTATPPESFYSQVISGVQRLANGNTLICSGLNGTFFEVTSSKEIVWRYVNPVTGAGILTQGDTIPAGQPGGANSVFKIRRYSPDYPGFAGRDLRPGDFIERYTAAVVPYAGRSPGSPLLLQSYPNPFAARATIRFRVPGRAAPQENAGRYALEIFDPLGRPILIHAGEAEPGATTEIQFDPVAIAAPLPRGVYLCRLITSSGCATMPMIHAP